MTSRSWRSSALVLLLLVGMALSAAPARAQSLGDLIPLPVPVPGLEDGVAAIEDLVDIEGLPLVSPVLETVTGVVTEVVARVDEVLAETPLPNTLALQGADAVDAAVAFSQATFDTADTVLLARDDVYADALTTGALQGIVDAPLLLTSSGDLDRRTAAEIVRLRADRVLVLGGDAAVNPLVLQKLDIAGFEVTRVGGPSRVETAVAAAQATAPDATTAVLARAYQATADASQAYADLLAVSPWAAQQGWPVLLTQTDVLTAPVAEHLAASQIREVVIVGGTAAVSQAVEDQVRALGIDVRRVAGQTRFGTAVAIAGERGFGDSGDAPGLVLAEGTAVTEDIWAPGFASAAFASDRQAPVLLTAGPVLPPETLAFLTHGVGDNLADGGPAVVCATFVDPVSCEAAGLLVLGHVSDVLELLDLQLVEIPFLEQVLVDLGLSDLLDLLDVLDGTVDGIIDGVASGDLQAVVDALTGAVGEVVGIVEGIIGSDVDPTDPVGTIDDVLGTIGDVLGGVTGGSGSDGGSGSGDGSGDGADGGDPLDPLDPITDPITDPVLGGGSGDGSTDGSGGGDAVEDAVDAAEDLITDVIGGVTGAVGGATGGSSSGCTLGILC